MIYKNFMHPIYCKSESFRSWAPIFRYTFFQKLSLCIKISKILHFFLLKTVSVKIYRLLLHFIIKIVFNTDIHVPFLLGISQTRPIFANMFPLFFLLYYVYNYKNNNKSNTYYILNVGN